MTQHRRSTTQDTRYTPVGTSSCGQRQKHVWVGLVDRQAALFAALRSHAGCRARHETNLPHRIQHTTLKVRNMTLRGKGTHRDPQ
mgnify:CR=1 FL=1